MLSKIFLLHLIPTSHSTQQTQISIVTPSHLRIFKWIPSEDNTESLAKSHFINYFSSNMNTRQYQFYLLFVTAPYEQDRAL